ncbi:hypothetical protein LTR86_009643 [Recurvomyces mirabilis]|nr:hypothetical protein LTR86_009643 [Recurvomyces mirabilis]
MSRYMSALVATLVTIAAADTRPADVTICDYYTNAIFGVNNATNQKAIVIAVVNTAVAGNYTHNVQKTNIAVPGILAQNVTYNGTSVNLLPYFDGSLASSSIDGKASAVNWLDGGGAAPLYKSMPASSNGTHQYTLMTHLYEYFGGVLGCSGYGKGFPSYNSTTSMYSVHKYMALNPFEVNYFIEQVGASAASWGVSPADVEIVGSTLQSLFGQKCTANTSVLPGSPPELQSICIDAACPQAPNASCSAYDAVEKPAAANGTATKHPSNGSAPNNASGTMPAGSSGTSKNGAVTLQPWFGTVISVLAAGLVLMLL